MTGKQQEQGGLTAIQADHGNVVSLHDTALVARRDDVPSPPSPTADLSNVIPFTRARRTSAEPSTPPVTIGPEDRPAAPPRGASAARRIAIVVCSLAVHGLLLFALWEAPKPLASIGTEAITVEIMAGDNRPAGLEVTPGQSATTKEEVKSDDRPIDQEQERTAEAREVKPEEKQTEVADEQPSEQQPEKRDELAMVETPQAVMPTAPPRATPPDMRAVIAPPREEPKDVKPAEPKAKHLERKKIEQKKATRPRPRLRTNAASGSGPASVSSDANYIGRVSAHLKRHKHDNEHVITGIGTVKFSIDGSGSVTSVSIGRSTGAAVLDQEMTAMVRRASPFPAPPDGQPRSFNVPVNFELREAKGGRQ